MNAPDAYRSAPFSTGWSMHGGCWSVRPDIESFDHEARSIYLSPQEPSHACWVVAWKGADGVSKVSFVEVLGDPTMCPTMNFNSPSLEGYNKTLTSEDGGRTWHDTDWKETLDNLDGNSDHHWRAVVVNEDGSLLRMMPRCLPGVTDPDIGRLVYDPAAAEKPHPFVAQCPYETAQTYLITYWRSQDGGRTWQEVCRYGPSSNMGRSNRGWFPTDLIRLRDSALLSIGRLGGGLGVTESSDDARTWSPPQALDLPIDLFGDLGWTEENVMTQLADGKVLVVCRVRGGDNRRLLRLARSGGRWEVDDHWVSDLPHAGHPFMRMAEDATIFYSGDYGVYSSLDEGRTWTKQADVSVYYPQWIEAEPRRIVTLGHHVGIGDSPWPPRQESDIRSAAFSYRPIEVLRQTDAGAGPCLAVLENSQCGNFHARARFSVMERAGIAFRIQDDPCKGYYVLVIRITDGPGRWPQPRDCRYVPAILELSKIVGAQSELIFKRFVGHARPGDLIELQIRMEADKILSAVKLPREGPREDVCVRGEPQYMAASSGDLAQGRLGLFTHLCAAEFKDFTIWNEPQMIRDCWHG